MWYSLTQQDKEMKNQLTKNFCLAELTSSETARICHIDNTPSEEVCLKLKSLCENVLQPLREAWGGAIVVTSGYRCKALNKKVGGASNSDHLYGCAADIKSLAGGREKNKMLFDLAVKMMSDKKLVGVKQIIDEHGYRWIHISWQDGRTMKRNQVLHKPK